MAGGSENPDTRRNFILQQGLDAPAQEGCPVRFSSLMFQPRLVGLFTLLADILQSPTIFLVLSGWTSPDFLDTHQAGVRATCSKSCGLT
jgi:hypothetical protein